MDRTYASADPMRPRPLHARAARPDLRRRSEFAQVATEGPETVEFGSDANDTELPTASLGTPERHGVDPDPSKAALSATQGLVDIDEPLAPDELSPAPVAQAPAVQSPQNAPDLDVAREIGPGSVLRGRYLIEKPLGVGGSSMVFAAVDRHRIQGPGTYGKVAVKILQPRFRQDQARVFRLIREFRHMQRLTHAGIARVFDLDCDNGVWFITMELLDGQSLHRQLKDRLKEGEALTILTRCTEALAYAHDQGVVHGDLKPGNIFITADGAIRLLDFGSVPDRDEATTADCSPLHLAATLAYASPEMLEEKGIEPRDDLFSLGCIAYELFSGGQHPFGRKSSLQARGDGLPPADVRAIPARRFAVIVRMLAWERAARPASARAFLHAFLAADFRDDPPQPTTSSRPIVAGKSRPTSDPLLQGMGNPRAAGSVIAKPEPARNTPADLAADFRDDPPQPTTSSRPIVAGKSRPTPDSLLQGMGNPRATGSVIAKPEPARSTPAELRTGDAAELKPDLPPDLSGAPPAGLESVEDADRNEAANEAAIARTFATFAGVVPAEWRGPGSRLPIVPTAPPAVPEPQKVPTPAKQAPAAIKEVEAPRVERPAVRRAAATDRESSALVAPRLLTRKTLVIALIVLLLIAGVVASRLRTTPPSPPVAPAAAVSTALMEAIANVPFLTTIEHEIMVPAPDPAAVIAASPVVAPAATPASFQSPTIRVGSSQQMAVVNVVREKSIAGRAQVALSVVGNTAKPGVDYESPDSVIAQFNDGQRVRSLYIPIKHPAADGGAYGERRFTVKLKKVAGALSPGRVDSTEVIISAP